MTGAPFLPISPSAVRRARPSVAVALGDGEVDALLCVHCGDARLRWLSRSSRGGSEKAEHEVATADSRDTATAWATCGRCGATSVWHGTSLVFPVLTMPELATYQLRIALRALASATYEDADRTAEVDALRARRDELRRFRLRALSYAPPLGPMVEGARSPWATAEDALVMTVAAGEERALDRLIASSPETSRESMAHLRDAVVTCWHQVCALGVPMSLDAPAPGHEDVTVHQAVADGDAATFI